MQMLNGVTTVSPGRAISAQLIASMSVQAVVYGTGTVSATVVIEGTNNGTDWVAIATLSPSGTPRGVDGGAVTLPPWNTMRARVTAISGTNAAVDVDYQSRSAGYGA